MDSISFGLVFIAIWIVTYIKVNKWWANLLVFVFMFFGCYFLILGVIQAAYSLVHNAKINKKEANNNVAGKFVGQMVLFLTQICGLVIAIINVVKAVNG